MIGDEMIGQDGQLGLGILGTHPDGALLILRAVDQGINLAIDGHRVHMVVLP